MHATRKQPFGRRWLPRSRLGPDPIRSQPPVGCIREMKPEDAPQACALSDSEGWGFDVSDFKRILDLWPGGSFVCEEKGRIIGMLTTATYVRSGWIGNVVVEERFRSSGLGSVLVCRGLDHLQRQKMEAVLLYSYKGLEGFYRRFGFRELDSYECYRGRIKARGKRICAERMCKDDLDDVRELDARRFGDDRSRLLERLLRDFPETSLVHRSGDRLMGYVMATASGRVCNIGPGIALARSSARLLLESLGVLLRGKECFLVAPSQVGAGLAGELGLISSFSVTRMARGIPPEVRTDEIFAIGALEKG